MIKIITDSSCDLKFETIQRLDVLMIPFTIDLNNVLYKDKIDITEEEFYTKIMEKDVFPKTFQIAPAIYESIFLEELNKGNDIICITASSELTGTYNSANLAKNNIGSDRIYIVDSTLATLGQGILVMKAAEMSKEGASIEDILLELDYLIKHQGSIFALDTLEMLKKGGRIPSSLAAIGSLLNIKPILTFVSGKLVVQSKIRGTKAITKTLIKYLEEYVDCNRTIMIAHAYNKEYCEIIENMVKSLYPDTEIYSACLGASVGSHSGPKAIGLFFTKKNL